MSLELALNNATNAIERLIAVLTETVPQPVTINLGEMRLPPEGAENSAPIAAETAEIDPPKKTRAKKEKASAPLEPADTAEAPEPQEAGAPASTSEAEPTYAEAAKAVTALIKAKGSKAAKAILKRFNGADHLQKVDPSDYGALICACELELA